MTEPIQINGETFAPVVVECPADDCSAQIDAQRVLYEYRQCPTCRTPVEDLLADYRGTEPPEHEPESYKLEA
jgi:hypothetical protein